MVTIHLIKKRKVKQSGFDEITRQAKIPGSVYLETCIRSEVYSGKGFVPDTVSKHLFRVVSGLESAFIGESAVLGQVKSAYKQASKIGKLDKSLHKLFQRAFYVSRKVRNKTDITRGAISYGQASADFLSKTVGKKLINANITLIGAHKLNDNILHYLVKKGASTLFIANRTFENALLLAKKYNGKAYRFDNLQELLKTTDVLISATSAPHYVIKKEQFPKDKQMLILDLAIPQDIDPEIGNIKDVTLKRLEEIETIICKNLENRKAKIDLAELIIEEEVKRFNHEQEYHLNFFKKSKLKNVTQ